MLQTEQTDTAANISNESARASLHQPSSKITDMSRDVSAPYGCCAAPSVYGFTKRFYIYVSFVYTTT